MNNPLPKVSIIFPNYNGGRLNLDCLQSIEKLNYPKEKIETIVVDNGSTDESDIKIKSKFRNVKLIKNKQNLGFAKAINIGAKIAKGSFLLITNNDIIIDKDCVGNLVNFLQKTPSVGIIGPAIYDLKNPQKILGYPLRYHFYLGTFTNLPFINSPQEVDWVQGCSLLCWAKLFKKLGGFDEGFFFTGEELDFCFRAKKIGYKTVYYPNAKIWHAGGTTINQPAMENFKYLEGYKSKFRLLFKHATLLQIATALTLQFLIFTPYRTLILREKSLVPAIRAFIWNLANLPKTFKLRQTIYAKLS